jgi:hypothetical protein
MQERSLRITGTDKTFFNKLSNTLTKMLIPTKIGINGMLITVKRNSLLKAYELLMQGGVTSDKKEQIENKYETALTAYLETLDKYVLDSIYKKVKNDTATQFERQALSDYYGVIRLKENEYVEYKYRKQKYLLELDYESLKISKKDKVFNKYKKFYIYKMDALYKGILKNYSIKLADSTSTYDSSKEWIYIKIFSTLQDYIENILPIKFEEEPEENYKDIKMEYEKYEKFMVGKLDTRDNIEKNMVLLGISRKLFTHSLPLVVAEQCYVKLLKDARTLVQDTKIANKRERAYSMLITIIEVYNIKLLSTKVYWEDQAKKEEYNKFLEEFKQIEKIKENDFIEYIKQKEILFLKDDMKKLRDEKTDYTKLIKYYKRKLVDYGVMKEIRGVRTTKKFIRKKAVA